ncbi:MAG TPA: class I SAM-dependent methyltransferase [Fimbriimonadaceae bacterium]|nr:class I SAM-dependent methyltransferase [Fimbriimonadaceae bacterium]
MSRSFLIPDGLSDYIESSWLREDPVLRDLREETSKLENSAMQIGPDQGQFMALLVRAIGARRCLEIGVFTGYSSTVVAMALPDDGKIIACDVSEEFTNVARRYWEKAGVANKIELRLGPASETLDAILESGGAETFDFAFIDADKPNYLAYYERVLSLVCKGGLIAIDNVLWSGKVADLSVLDEQTLAIRQVNEHLHKDDRIDLCLVPIGDGLTVARKR